MTHSPIAPLRYPWPMAPGIRGWRVTTTIPLTDTDRAAVSWMLETFPGGLSSPANLPRLAALWLEWLAKTLTDTASTAAVPDTPPFVFGWWFFLASLDRWALWRALWKSRLHYEIIAELDLAVRLPALPGDRRRMRDPFTAEHWLAAVAPPDAALEARTTLDAVWDAWRRSFWAVWRRRASTLSGTVRPWWGMADRMIADAIRDIIVLKR